MMAQDVTRYTLVRHTGYSVGGNRQFEHAVELRAISGKTATQQVVKAGGLIFASYSEASMREEAENYPPGATGLIPAATGKFSQRKVSGEEIYIPAKSTGA
jgi:hypothetical protein